MEKNVHVCGDNCLKLLYSYIASRYSCLHPGQIVYVDVNYLSKLLSNYTDHNTFAQNSLTESFPTQCACHTYCSSKFFMTHIVFFHTMCGMKNVEEQCVWYAHCVGNDCVKL